MCWWSAVLQLCRSTSLPLYAKQKQLPSIVASAIIFPHLLHALLRDTLGKARLWHTCPPPFVYAILTSSMHCSAMRLAEPCCCRQFFLRQFKTVCAPPPFVPISPPPCTAQQCAWQSSAPQTWRRHQSSLHAVVVLIVCFTCVVCVYVLFVGCAMSAAACNNPAPLPAAGRVVCASRIYHTMQVTANTIPT